MYQNLLPPLSPAAYSGPIVPPARSAGRTVGKPPYDPPSELNGEPEPRQLARTDDFGYPTAGSAGAQVYLDALQRDAGPPVHLAVDKRGAPPQPTRLQRDYWNTPRATLAKTYADLIRTNPPAAANYRKVVTEAFSAHGGVEGERMDQWMDQVATFMRRGADLLAATLQRADANILPFVREEVTRQIDDGLALLHNEATPPPTLTPTGVVLARAEAERSRRIAEIDNFYAQALLGGKIVGLPPAKQHTTSWIVQGRLVFERLDDALRMAPRAVFVDYLYAWPPTRSIKNIQYGPLNFHGERPKRIDYRDTNFKMRFWNSADDAYKAIGASPEPHEGYEANRYHLRGGTPLPFPASTTLELELIKANAFARIHEAAWHAVQDPPPVQPEPPSDELDLPW